MGCPAYAGMDPCGVVMPSYSVRLPRLRGDGPQILSRNLLRRLAAPPTRGWTRDDYH